MSLRFTIDELQKKREAAGLGMLSLGLYGTGDLVSSTPIPGSRQMGGVADPSYGGYLLGEGMTREAAMYLGSLHNHFPALAEAASSHSFECMECGQVVEVTGIRCGACKGADSDSAYLDAIGKIAEKHGWHIFQGPLSQWIDEHLIDIPSQDAITAQNLNWKNYREALDRAEAAESRASSFERLLHSLEFAAAKTVELHKQGLLGEPGDSRQIDNLSALLLVNAEVDDGMPF